jgi:hypothetical protein
MQNIVQTVDMLSNLLSELDIVLLQLPASHADNLQYRRQFRTDFRICQQYILMWLYFLKANYPGYRHITISTDCITAFPVDSNVSSSVIYIIDDTLSLDGPVERTDALVEPADTLPTSESAVLSLD